jgi:DNA-binding transcriptional LysR family regulator
MELLQIRHFLAVAECLNFTKAAELLNTTQPTVSKRIADLEEELQVKLFYRSKNFVMPTPIGELLVRECKKICENVKDIRKIVECAGKGDIGKIQIGVPGLMDINHILPDFFVDFIRKYPNVHLCIETYDFQQLHTMLFNRELDLIFTFIFEPQDDRTNRIILSRKNTRLYFSRSLVNKPAGELSFNDFKDKAVIMREASVSNYLKKIYEKLDFTPTEIIRVKTMESLRSYLESGAGIAFIGASYRLLENDKIDFLEIDDKELQVGTDAIWLKDNQNPSLPACVDAIIAHIDDKQNEETVPAE